jgi:hypothetical protein
MHLPVPYKRDHTLVLDFRKICGGRRKPIVKGRKNSRSRKSNDSGSKRRKPMVKRRRR